MYLYPSEEDQMVLLDVLRRQLELNQHCKVINECSIHTPSNTEFLLSGSFSDQKAFIDNQGLCTVRYGDVVDNDSVDYQLSGSQLVQAIEELKLALPKLAYLLQDATTAVMHALHEKAA